MPDNPICCICHEPVEEPYNILGGRRYCAKHYAAVNRSHPGFWRAGVIQIGGMGIFSLIVAAIAGTLGPLDRTAQLLIGLFLAIVPSALWLFYFYRQDRLEPEPKTHIGLVFVAALVATDFLALRLINNWFQVGEWAPRNLETSLGAAILINGFILQACMYLAVRLVYAGSEFDERMDGIVYGTVAGLGVATLLNLHYIIDNQGVELVPGVINVVTTALAQASFGGLMGWFMAEDKFSQRPVWFVPGGFAIAAGLNGLFSWLTNEVSATGLEVEPLRSLIMGLGVALAAFGVLVWLMHFSTQVTLRRRNNP
ncbi:Protease PrsW [Thermoflexales bacterium]|nr:Protease PrsW [Thermoflexales bacterium]